MNDHHLRYPIGEFIAPKEANKTELDRAIETIKRFPLELKKAVETLNKDQLDTPYRPGSWTVRQLIHHCADSHINAIIRFKLALTEDRPTIKPYEQDKWVLLSDVQKSEIQSSLSILDGIHHRLGHLLENLQEKEWSRTYIHPEHGQEFTIAYTAFNYAWHSSHHLAHITELVKRKNW